MANPAADTGKWVILFKQRQRLPILSFFDQSDKSLDADVSRADRFAWGGSFFADGKSAGYRLGVLFECRPPFGQSFVVIIRKSHRADVGTLPAAGAFGNVYESGFLTDAGGKTPGLAVKPQELGIR